MKNVIKKLSLFILTFIINISVFCDVQGLYEFENNTYYFKAYYDDLLDPPFKMSFISGDFYLDIPELDNEKIEDGKFIAGNIQGKYNLKIENSFIYLYVREKKYLVLHSGSTICILLDCSTGDTFFGINENSDYVNLGNRVFDNFIGFIGAMNDYQKQSSMLTEKISNKEIAYNGIDKYYYQLSKPWVEGKDGNGIGEWIEKRIVQNIDEIVFFNGYISPNRPDLFFLNSRVKLLTIICNSESWSFGLDDNPHPQILKLPKKITGTIRFMISDVYPGAKYSDTSIAGVYFLLKKSH
jgi:hypothetical protein